MLTRFLHVFSEISKAEASRPGSLSLRPNQQPQECAHILAANGWSLQLLYCDIYYITSPQRLQEKMPGAVRLRGKINLYDLVLHLHLAGQPYYKRLSLVVRMAHQKKFER